MEEKTFLPENGCLGTGESVHDFLLEGSVNLPKLTKQNIVRFEYNQNARVDTQLDCTLFASFGAISDLFDYQVTDTDITEIKAIATSMGKQEHAGRYVKEAVDCVAKRWNAKMDEKIVYLRLALDSEYAKEAVDKNYTLVTGFQTDGTWYRDAMADATLSITRNTDTPCLGHSVDVISDGADGFAVKDNYVGTSPCNVYRVEHMKELIQNGVFDQYAYLYIPQKLLTATIQGLKNITRQILQIKAKIASNSKAREATKNKKLRAQLHEENEKLRSQILSLQTQI